MWFSLFPRIPMAVSFQAHLGSGVHEIRMPFADQMPLYSVSKCRLGGRPSW